MSEGKSPLRTARALIIGLAAVIVVLGAALIIMAIGRSGTQVPLEQINVLADSNDPCVVCHRRTTPGIVEQYGHSRMAAANVSCQQCHVVQSNYPSAEEHQGAYILRSPTTAICQNCHGVEVAQFYQSRHSLPAYVAFAGSKDLSPQLLAMYQAIPEGTFNPDSSRNAIAELEGPDMTPFTCANCHSIGAPAADGSVGECQKCHLRHEFSREQARKPETCNACHIGPDHPQYEIYTESPHGIAYHTLGQNWHWEAAPGTLTVNDFPAPTCAICHMSGFGPSGTTHDVGDRLTWFLFAPISQRRPNWQDNIVRMQGVCMACHNKNFIDDFYTAADTATERVNSWVQQSDAMIAPLKDKGLLTAAPFDEPIDYTYFELWHHWGRTAKFGTWMQGPDYAQWHGAYEVLKALAELKTEIDEKLAAPAAGTGQ
jgi:hydroxylamine dehydrogenase